jgi:hypothetical protein
MGKRALTREPIHEQKKDLVCLRIILGRRCQSGNGVVEHHADEEDKNYPAQWPDFPSGIHAASLGMPIKRACVSLRRDFQHRG